MKRILVVFAFLAIGLGLSAQTLVKEDKVVTFTHADTLKKTVDSVFSVTFYGKDFFVNMHLQINADSAAGTASGYTKLEATVEGSLDHSSWTAFDDTITLSALGADSDEQLYSGIYWDYLRVKVRSLDSVQNTLLDYNILFDVNQ